MRDASGAVAVTTVLGLVPDKDGSLWLRLEGTNLLRYHNGRIRIARAPS